jgi:uncharacterized membrane protein (DUF4010 family)
VASAATLAAAGTLSPDVAGAGAIIASGTSALVDLPIVARLAGDRRLTRRVGWAFGATVLLGVIGTLLQLALHRA